MSRVVAAPLTSRHVTHVLLQPVASVVNPTPTVCHTGTAPDDVITDQWRRSLVIDTSEPYVVSMVSSVIVYLIFTFVTTFCYWIRFCICLFYLAARSVCCQITTARTVFAARCYA